MEVGKVVMKAMLVLLLCWVLGGTMGTPMEVWSSEAVDYLAMYGYLDDSIRGFNSDEMPIGTMPGAIAKFQDLAGLKVTGVLDHETKELMKMPRCSIKDVTPDDNKRRRRKRRYVLDGSKWESRDLTYRLHNLPTKSSMTETQIRQEIHEAFQIWADVIPLTFTERTSGVAHMDLSFLRGEHGDGNPFDGKGGQLAHAFPPKYGGDTHFDDDEDFTTHTSKGDNFLVTATHEFGHALGMFHSKDRTAIMTAYTLGYIPDLKLSPDDIKGIQALYGKGTKKSTSKKKTQNPLRKPDPMLCKDQTFDVIFPTDNYNLNIIKGNKHYLLDEKGLVPGYPKATQNTWERLPNKVDAVLLSSGGNIFFSGSQYYLYEKNKFSNQGTIRSVMPGIPDNIDSVMGIGKDILVVKDNKIWKFDFKNSKVYPSYPKRLPVLPGAKKKVTSMLRLKSGFYFITGDSFYKVDEKTFEVKDAYPPYPWPNGPMWLGCKK